MTDPQDIKEAFAAGAEQAAIKAQLAQHEIRFDRINGSIDRGAASVERLGDRFEEFVAKASERDAVAAKEREMIRESTELAAAKQINSRSWRLGIITVSAMLFGVIIALITLLANLPHA